MRMEATEEEKHTACALTRAPFLNNNHFGLLLLRVGVSIMMLVHGIPKLIMLWNGQGAEWLNPIGIGSTLSLFLATFAEFFCSILILLGFMTRLAAFVLFINFCVIVFAYDAGTPWSVAEFPTLYLLVYGVLVLTGAGRLSIDRVLARRFAQRAACCRVRENR